MTPIQTPISAYGVLPDFIASLPNRFGNGENLWAAIEEMLGAALLAHLPVGLKRSIAAFDTLLQTDAIAESYRIAMFQGLLRDLEDRQQERSMKPGCLLHRAILQRIVAICPTRMRADVRLDVYRQISEAIAFPEPASSAIAAAIALVEHEIDEAKKARAAEAA